MLGQDGRMVTSAVWIIAMAADACFPAGEKRFLGGYRGSICCAGSGGFVVTFCGPDGLPGLSGTIRQNGFTRRDARTRHDRLLSLLARNRHPPSHLAEHLGRRRRA